MSFLMRTFIIKFILKFSQITANVKPQMQLNITFFQTFYLIIVIKKV
jgi:hypothetical protein